MNTILTSEYYSSTDSGLVGYWRLDEGSGQTAEDLSFYSNGATLGANTNFETSDPAWVPANLLIVDVKDENKNNLIPRKFSLSQNYPNPFNPTTKIEFQIATFGFVRLKVFDILGNEVVALVNEEKHPGKYEIVFDASKFSSGIYFYQLKTGQYIETKKMILLR
jgi:hypothetical protein